MVRSAARKVLSRPLNLVVNRLFRIRNLNLAFRVVLWYCYDCSVMLFLDTCFLNKVAVMSWKVCSCVCIGFNKASRKMLLLVTNKFGGKKELWKNQSANLTVIYLTSHICITTRWERSFKFEYSFYDICSKKGISWQQKINEFIHAETS